MDSSLTASDIALLNNDNGFGNNSSFFWIFALLILAGGGLGFGSYRNNDFSNFATSASQSEILLGQQFQNLGQAINGIGNGLCSSTYDLNNSIHGVNMNISNEARSISNQLATCCCENKESTAQVRYDMANFASAINSNIDNKFAQLEKNQLSAQIAEQAQKINELQMANMMCGVVRYPNASTYYAGSNPFGAPCPCNNM